MKILIDSHVHIHDSYDINKFLSNVFQNFGRIAESNNLNSTFKGMLCLTEMKGVNFYNSLQKDSLKINSDDYKIEQTSEDLSIKISDVDGNEIFLFNGKQIIAENGLEVLALCQGEEIEEGKSLSETIQKVNQNNGIPILPWGVGKWTGKRAEILNDFIEKNKSEKYFLGDNSGRPTFWGEPKLFKVAEEKGHFVLQGTDALNIPSEVSKTGSYGFILEMELDEQYPAKSFRNEVIKLDKTPVSFGKLESPFKFFVNQIKMQINKHLK